MADRNTPRDNARNERLDTLAGTRGVDEAVTESELAEKVADRIGFITRQIINAKSAVLGVDVALTTSGQWYDGPYAGLRVGSWLIMSMAQFRADAAAVASTIQARLVDSTGKVLAAQQLNTAGASGDVLAFSMIAPLIVTKARSVKLQMRASAGNANLKMKATAPAAGSDVVATRIYALRIGD